MTTTPPSPDDARDELVSAVLDGEADDAARAQVAADPELTARLEQMRAVRDLVAAPVEPLDEVTAQRIRRSAMAAAGAGTRNEPTATRRVSRVATWLGSAAAVIVLIALVGVAVIGGSVGDGESDQLAGESADDSGGDAAAEMSSADESMEEMDRASSDEDGLTLAPLAAALGDHSTDQALADAALGGFEYSAGSTELESTNGAGEVPADDGTNPAAPDLDAARALENCPLGVGDEVVSFGTGTVAGEPRYVRVVRLADGTVEAQVLGDDGCTLLATAR